MKLGLLLGVLQSVAIFGHGLWITGPESAKKGDRVTVEVLYGHHFPEGENGLNSVGLKLFVLEAGAAPKELPLRKVKTNLSAEFTAAGGPLKYYLVQDRGVVSRTPQGVKPGGKKENPNATRTYRTMQVAATANEENASLPCSLTAKVQGKTITLQAFRKGSPFAGATVNVTAPAGKEQELGKTGSDGAFRYTIPAGATGTLLFGAEFTEKANSAEYEQDRYAAFLTVRVP